MPEQLETTRVSILYLKISALELESVIDAIYTRYKPRKFTIFSRSFAGARYVIRLINYQRHLFTSHTHTRVLTDSRVLLASSALFTLESETYIYSGSRERERKEGNSLESACETNRTSRARVNTQAFKYTHSPNRTRTY